MIGIIVGLVSSLIIFSFYSKDQKAVKANKQRKIQQEKDKQTQQKRKQEEIQKFKNDPVLKKKRQQQQKQFSEKFMNNLDQKDKAVISEYLQKNKKQGKTDQQAIKQASTQASLFMAFMFIIVITLIVSILILSGVKLQQVQNKIMTFLGQFFPKIKEATSAASTDL